MGVAGRIGGLDQCSLITWGAFKITLTLGPTPANSDLIVPGYSMATVKFLKLPR